MEVCYAEALAMPKRYAVMNEQEMMYVDGGVDHINIGMMQSYLNKTVCIEQGKGIIRTHNWKNVTSLQLAKEIYGHAVVYYKAAILSKIPVLNDAIYSHVANGVDLDNAVDRYQTVWDTIWNL